MNDEKIAQLFDNELTPARALNAALDRLLNTTKRHVYVYEAVPVGHDLGWRCYDPAKYDGDPAEGDTTCGYGLTQNEAYADYLRQRDDERPTRMPRLVHSSQESPPEYKYDAEKDPDDIDFDDGLSADDHPR